MMYKLVPLRRKDEGVFMWFFFSGTISEWLLHSYRPKMIVAKNPAGFTITSGGPLAHMRNNVLVCVCVSRVRPLRAGFV